MKREVPSWFIDMEMAEVERRSCLIMDMALRDKKSISEVAFYGVRDILSL